ncbi:Transcriptional regulator, PadR family [Arthrobacter sp. PAMC 25486]|nr:Transcriptional regulator, PadR family [Arthrobacter sp. PAMC 25486]
MGLCALQALKDGPTYGYAIITALEAAGLGTFKGGTLYPLLARFETAGWVSVEWRPGESGPGRKYFSLTPAGLDELARQRRQWLAFTTSTTAFLAIPTDRGVS